MRSSHPLRQRRPVLFHAGISLALAGLLAGGLWHFLSGRWQWLPWLLAWFGAINLVALLYYGLDKRGAQRDSRRVPESVLHTLALVGGSIGAYAGMQFFRHKTLKGRFRMVFWMIVVVQIGLVGWTAFELWRA